MESEVATSEDTQTGPSSEYVDLHEASDADLEAFLAKGDEVAAPQQAEQPANPEAKTEQKVEPQTDEPKVEQAASKQDPEAMRKQLEQQELFIKRRNSEIGELRKQLRAAQEQLQTSLDEKFYESPTQALAQARQIEMAQQKINELDAEEQELTNTHQAQVLLAHHVGPEGLDVEAVGEALASDGMPSEFIQHFLSNPYQAALPETLIQLAKRAQAERKVKQMEQALSQLVPYTQKLLEERKSLPNNVLRNVQSALRQSPQVTGSAGGTGQVSGSGAVNFASMSEAELNEFLEM
jgi:hypothetical protein